MLTEGYYVATLLDENLQIGYDHFVINETSEGLLVEARHILRGHSISIEQTSTFELDKDWTPRKLEVNVQSQNLLATVVFGDDKTTIKYETSEKEEEEHYPVSRKNAYFLLNNVLYFPLYIVKRFDFNRPGIQKFETIPTGICEVRHCEDVNENGNILKVLEARITIDSMQELLRLIVNEKGDLLRYKTQKNLLVELNKEIANA